MGLAAVIFICCFHCTFQTPTPNPSPAAALQVPQPCSNLPPPPPQHHHRQTPSFPCSDHHIAPAGASSVPMLRISPRPTSSGGYSSHSPALMPGQPSMSPNQMAGAVGAPPCATSPTVGYNALSANRFNGKLNGLYNNLAVEDGKVGWCCWIDGDAENNETGCFE